MIIVASIDRRLPIAISSGIDIYLFLPMHPVYASTYLGFLYTTQIFLEHQCCVMELVCMLITTVVDICNGLIACRLLMSSRIMFVERQTMMYL